MNKNIIDVELITEEEKQLLVFNFDEKIFLDLASDNAEELKDFFQQLLIKILEKNIELNFVEKDRNDLFYDVAKKYVDHLKVEIASIDNQQLNKIDD